MSRRMAQGFFLDPEDSFLVRGSVASRIMRRENKRTGRKGELNDKDFFPTHAMEAYEDAMNGPELACATCGDEILECVCFDYEEAILLDHLSSQSRRGWTGHDSLGFFRRVTLLPSFNSLVLKVTEKDGRWYYSARNRYRFSSSEKACFGEGVLVEGSTSTSSSAKSAVMQKIKQLVRGKTTT